MITQDAFTSGRSLVEIILEKMVGNHKWQKVFFLLKRSFYLLLSMEVGCLTIIDVKQNTAYTHGPKKKGRGCPKKYSGKVAA